MSKYLVTFPNMFEYAKFKENFKDYFQDTNKVEIVHHSRTFCNISTRPHNQFYHLLLSRNCPGIKIVLKQQHKHRTNYIEL